jgi:hypothetical protein
MSSNGSGTTNASGSTNESIIAPIGFEAPPVMPPPHPETLLNINFEENLNEFFFQLPNPPPAAQNVNNILVLEDQHINEVVEIQNVQNNIADIEAVVQQVELEQQGIVNSSHPTNNIDLLDISNGVEINQKNNTKDANKFLNFINTEDQKDHYYDGQMNGLNEALKHLTDEVSLFVIQSKQNNELIMQHSNENKEFLMKLSEQSRETNFFFMKQNELIMKQSKENNDLFTKQSKENNEYFMKQSKENNDLFTKQSKENNEFFIKQSKNNNNLLVGVSLGTFILTSFLIAVVVAKK